MPHRRFKSYSSNGSQARHLASQASRSACGGMFGACVWRWRCARVTRRAVRRRVRFSDRTSENPTGTRVYDGFRAPRARRVMMASTRARS